MKNNKFKQLLVAFGASFAAAGGLTSCEEKQDKATYYLNDATISNDGTLVINAEHDSTHKDTTFRLELASTRYNKDFMENKPGVMMLGIAETPPPSLMQSDWEEKTSEIALFQGDDRILIKNNTSEDNIALGKKIGAIADSLTQAQGKEYGERKNGALYVHMKVL